jgi:hypothetical protein
MALTTEGIVMRDVMVLLDSLGEDCWYYCPVPMGYGRKGIPDFIGCYRGNFFAVECKAAYKYCSRWQEKEWASIENADGMYWLVCPGSIEHFLEHFDRSMRLHSDQDNHNAL